MKKTIDTLNKEIIEQIKKHLDNLGIMFRIFSRIKDFNSLERKISSNPKYKNREVKIQDLLGIRIVLYFPDDIKIVHNIISDLYKENNKDSSIDVLTEDTFRPIRYNIIYKTPGEDITIDSPYAELIDHTFEVQIRTVLSEGWHEVEHDLRYKFRDDWANSSEEYRKLNGVYASLETSEWTMLQIFQSVSYKHYKNKNWEAMLRHQFRIRISDFVLDSSIKNILDNDVDLAKKIFKLNRDDLIREMYRRGYDYPLKLNNIIYFLNIFFIRL